MRSLLLLGAALAALAAGAPPALAQARPEAKPATDVRADRRATAESIAAQYAAEQFRAARVGDETVLRLLAENEAQRRRISTVLRDARGSAAQRDAARAELKSLDAELGSVNARLLSSEEAGEALKAQVLEYQRQIAEAVDAASPEVLAAYQLYAEGDRDTAYAVIDRLSQAEAAAAKRAGEIRAGALLRRPAMLALDRRERGEMDTAQVIVAWERAQLADPSYQRGWVDLVELYIEAGRVTDARSAADRSIAAASSDSERGVALAQRGEIQVMLGDRFEAQRSYDEALVLLRKVAAGAPRDLKPQRDLVAILDRLGDLDGAFDDHRSAQTRFDEGLAIARRLAAAQPDSETARRDLAIAITKSADVRVSLGDYAGARPLHDESLALARALAAAKPDSAGRREFLAVALFKAGEFQAASRTAAAGRPHFEEGLAIVRPLAVADPANVALRRLLGVGLDRLAGSLDLPRELAAYRTLMDESVSLIREVVAVDQANIDALRDLSATLGVYGAGLAQAGDQDGALRRHEEALLYSRRVAEMPTSTGEDKRRLALRLGKLAEARLAMGDREGGRRMFEESNAVRRKLVELNPTASSVKLDLMSGLAALAESRVEEGDPSGARALFEEALVIADAALKSDPANRQLRRARAAAMDRLGGLHLDQRDLDRAAESLGGALAEFRELARTDQDDPEALKDYWAALWRWAAITGKPADWAETAYFMGFADERGFLSAQEKQYLAQARDRAKPRETTP